MFTRFIAVADNTYFVNFLSYEGQIIGIYPNRIRVYSQPKYCMNKVNPSLKEARKKNAMFPTSGKKEKEYNKKEKELPTFFLFIR